MANPLLKNRLNTMKMDWSRAPAQTGPGASPNRSQAHSQSVNSDRNTPRCPQPPALDFLHPNL